jgi:hypothetical protein
MQRFSYCCVILDEFPEIIGQAKKSLNLYNLLKLRKNPDSLCMSRAECDAIWGNDVSQILNGF